MTLWAAEDGWPYPDALGDFVDLAGEAAPIASHLSAHVGGDVGEGAAAEQRGVDGPARDTEDRPGLTGGNNQGVPEGAPVRAGALRNGSRRSERAAVEGHRAGTQSHPVGSNHHRAAAAGRRDPEDAVANDGAAAVEIAQCLRDV